LGDFWGGLKETIIPAILIVVVPTTFLGFLLSKGAPLNFIVVALPLIILVDIAANIINNYEDWEIDKANKKREVMHSAFKKNDLLYMYLVVIVAVFAILMLSGANKYLWISVLAYIFLGIIYSLAIKLKNIAILNYAAIAIAYAGMSAAIGFFSGSIDLSLFLKWSPIFIFLILVDFGYSITKDYSDVKGDALHDKKTLPVLFGKPASIKIQFAIVTVAYIYLLVAVLTRLLSPAFLFLFISYGFALYIIVTAHRTEDRHIHRKLHHHAQRNGFLARLIIIIILIVLALI
jgi:1,4-dihydroxy-2-naphthoate polyprenyltransferase